MRLFVVGALCFVAIMSIGASAQDITPPPAAPQGADPASLLPALIAHSRHTATIVDGRLTGEGADFLRALGRNSQFVMIGEDHGYSGIAEFATAYWRDLNEIGYQYDAIEVDPYIAEAAIRELRAGGPAQWGRYLAAHGGSVGAPFLNWAPEVTLAQTVLQTSRARREPPIWGLDQVFDGSGAARFRDIADHAHNAEARSFANALATEGESNVTHDWYPKLDPARLQHLRSLLSSRADAHWAELVDAMIVSQRIYAPFFNLPGEAYLANTERETLMKRTFLARYNAALAADHSPPRVMLKLGSYHITRGATPTHVQGLGGFVTEFATEHGTQATSILAVCGPGGAVGGAEHPTPCDAPFASQLAFLGDSVSRDQLTIYDLREWRLRGRRWEHLPFDWRQAIDSYDVMVVIPGRPASPMAEGLPLPH